MSSPEEIKAEYTSSLADLKFNSKPLINVLTMLAEENSPNAQVIVEAIETHLSKVCADVKLPVLYLIDCIVKNVGGTYTSLFSKNIVSTFCGVFGVVNEKTRAEMFKLRQTWNDVFPQMKLYAIDVQIAHLDPAWPVTAKPPPNSIIHFNPKFLKNTTSTVKNVGEIDSSATPSVIASTPAALDKETLLMQEHLIQKQRELLELKQKKLELEVLQTKVKLQEQIKNKPPLNTVLPGRAQNILLKPEVAKQLITTLKPQASNVSISIANHQPKVSTTTSANGSGSRAQTATATSKPIRDPRLLRQQQKQTASGNNAATTANTHLKTANIDNNKIVTVNKSSARKLRTDPRLIVNKDDKITVPKSITVSSTSKSQIPKISRVSPRSGTDTASLKSSSSSSSLDSTAGGKNSKHSPIKLKKREKGERRSPKEKVKTNGDKTSVEATSSTTTATTEVTLSSFKGTKGVKNRNYVRRNLDSPEPSTTSTHDEDLRALVPPQKQPRLQTSGTTSPSAGVENKNGNEASPKGMDVDLRQIPANRKRLSADSSESPSAAKKSKSEIIDRLFGAKDTDLRQLPVSIKDTKSSEIGSRSPAKEPSVTVQPTIDLLRDDRPPTPPPPIISSPDLAAVRDSSKQNLDIVRAKLANATNKMTKAKSKKQPADESDLRLLEESDGLSKIIISTEDALKIRAGGMTKEQEADLLKKIIMQVEVKRLNKAKKIERSNSDEDDVSDDPPLDDGETTSSNVNEISLMPFKDKDERIIGINNAPPMTRQAGGGEFFPVQFGRDFRRFPGPQNWRGGRGARRGWEGQPHVRPLRPWLPPPGNWRNLPPQNFAPGLDNTDEEMVGGVNADVPNECMLPDGAVNQNEIKTIAIDGMQKDIRFYDETAVVFLNWDEPREINFLDTTGRRVFFNDTECFLGFNEPYKDVTINGVLHKVRLGAPSREIYIDYVPYECYFGSAGIRIELNEGTPVTVKLEGPPPQVKIGDVKRSDLVAGKISLFIDARVMVPVYLDAKPQNFVVNGQISTLKFVNALKTVLINDKPFDVEYGGLPKPIMINGKKHFVRFSVLPKGVKPGRVKIKDMENGVGGFSPSHQFDDNSQDSIPHFDPSEPALPIIGRNVRQNAADSPERNSNSPNVYQTMLEQQSLNNLDLLTNVMTPSLGPVSSTTAGYTLDHTQQPNNEPQNLPNVTVPNLPNTININDLFQKLVSSGFITTTDSTTTSTTTTPSVSKTDMKKKLKHLPPAVSEEAAAAKLKRNVCDVLKPISFAKPSTLKVRQAQLYAFLYSGMQCSSCGMRFSPEASLHYSQHLDWHFRQNRKGKRNSRVASSRKWFYSLSDWKNYEELEDLEEREKNYFDQQQQSESASDETEDDVELPSVPADPESTDECCKVCRDKFDQFFNEEKEEWHLKNAIRVEEKTYHPVCYEDYQKSLLVQTLDDSHLDQNSVEEEKEKKEEQIPGLEIVIDDDDDEEIKNADDEPYEPGDIVSLGSDESTKPEISETVEKHEEDGDDDDVILNEVAPIKIVVEDDDDDENLETNKSSGISNSVTVKTEKPDDGFVEVSGLVSLQNGGQIKIKSEPIDPDDLPPPEEDKPLEETPPPLETATIVEEPFPTRAELVPSMDGNIELVSTIPTTGANTVVSANRIKINISKPLPVIHNKEKESAPDSGFPSETYIDPSEPFPPGEEPEQQRPAKLKPTLKGVELKKMPPVRRGAELTGLCSIM